MQEDVLTNRPMQNCANGLRTDGSSWTRCAARAPVLHPRLVLMRCRDDLMCECGRFASEVLVVTRLTILVGARLRDCEACDFAMKFGGTKRKSQLPLCCLS